MEFTARELATMLAALRYWQQDLGANWPDTPISDHFYDETPLTPGEIDDLCERLNAKANEQPIHAVIQDGDMTGWCQVHQVWESHGELEGFESREEAFEREQRAGTTGLGPGRVRMQDGEYPQQADEM